MEGKRIICDYYKKGKKIPVFNEEAHRGYTAVNDLYGWLYRKGLLIKKSFIVKDYDGVCHFCIDAGSLEPYRSAMLKCGIANAALAVNLLLDRDIVPCMYTGAITLSRTMATYRTTDDIVSSSWECYMVQVFDAEGAHGIREIAENNGTEAAVAAMYKEIKWHKTCITDKNAATQNVLT